MIEYRCWCDLQQIFRKTIRRTSLPWDFKGKTYAYHVEHRSSDGAASTSAAAFAIRADGKCGLRLRLGLREDGRDRVERGEEIHWWLKVGEWVAC